MRIVARSRADESGMVVMGERVENVWFFDDADGMDVVLARQARMFDSRSAGAHHKAARQDLTRHSIRLHQQEPTYQRQYM